MGNENNGIDHCSSTGQQKMPQSDNIAPEGSNPENLEYQELMSRVVKGEIGPSSFTKEETARMSDIIEKEAELRKSLSNKEQPPQESNPEGQQELDYSSYPEVNRVPKVNLSGKEEVMRRRSQLSDSQHSKGSLEVITETVHTDSQNSEIQGREKRK